MKQHGPCINLDHSSKGNGRRHNTYRADTTIRGVRYRRRNKNKSALERWLSNIDKLRRNWRLP